MTLLNQLLGVRKSVNSSVGKAFVEAFRESQKIQLLTGISRQYTPKNDEGDQLPGEYQKVTATIEGINMDLLNKLARQYDVNATVDVSNTTATGDIEFNGQTIPDVPVTTLMWLEKQLAELASYIRSLPALDPAVDWEYDENSGVYKSVAVKTHRSVKVPKVITLAVATEKHPAQTQLFTEDVIVGYWDTTKLSGALPADKIRGMLDRVEDLRIAVGKAREQANMTEVTQFHIGRQLLDYVFRG